VTVLHERRSRDSKLSVSVDLVRFWLHVLALYASFRVLLELLTAAPRMRVLPVLAELAAVREPADGAPGVLQLATRGR